MVPRIGVTFLISIFCIIQVCIFGTCEAGCSDDTDCKKKDANKPYCDTNDCKCIGDDDVCDNTQDCNNGDCSLRTLLGGCKDNRTCHNNCPICDKSKCKCKECIYDVNCKNSSKPFCEDKKGVWKCVACRENSDCECGDQYTPWRDRCYYISKEFVTSWNQARDKCRSIPSIGSELSSITSQEEQDWIIGKLPSNWTYLYIGGTNAHSEGDWTWLDGQPWTFTNWDWEAGEPNNSGGIEHCIEVRGYNKLWNDISCEASVRHNYVCSYDPKKL